MQLLATDLRALLAFRRVTHGVMLSLASKHEKLVRAPWHGTGRTAANRALIKGSTRPSWELAVDSDSGSVSNRCCCCRFSAASLAIQKLTSAIAERSVGVLESLLVDSDFAIC